MAQGDARIVWRPSPTATAPRVPIQGGGESVADLQHRAASALESIARAHPGQRVLVVTHGGFLHATHRHATGGRAAIPRLWAGAEVSGRSWGRERGRCWPRQSCRWSSYKALLSRGP